MEDGVVRTVQPTYRMKPYDEKKFSAAAAKEICKEVVTSVLTGKSWNNEEEPVWTVQITEQIKARVRALDYPRYKIVVQVFLGENKHQGVNVASRCLWDAETDSHASYHFKTDDLWCTAIVFGLYTE